MTESELKKTIAIYKKTLEVTADNGETCFRELDKNTLLFLEELGQYRAIGTVEHIKLTFELCKGLDAMVKMYQAIGTVEEFKALKEQNAELHCELQSINATMGLFEQEIRNKAIDEFANTLTQRLTDAIYQQDVEGMTNLINDVARELKAGD